MLEKERDMLPSNESTMSL